MYAVLEVRRCLIVAVVALAWVSACAGQWTPLGPEGGDVRSLAYDAHDPDRIFLGTSAGTIFLSTNGGRSWARFAHLGRGDDYVIDHIVVDPQNSANIYVAAWNLGNHDGGELFHSSDGGKSWKTTPAMQGKSIRALAVAPSNSQILVAGALDGVFRSKDSGGKWQRISPIHTQIRNVESIAIDPENPDIIYAGTWHLAWKTENGGVSWHPINQGMIDDSDVFSMLIDRSNPQVIFASACSGIYKSQNRGALFERVLDIPFSARRTRVLKQDPDDAAVVYAGTTEGLWVTNDSGSTWKRVTSPEIVVNDVLIDAGTSRRVLIATDRAGVLAGNIGELNFTSSNTGFAHRYVTSILADKDDLNLLFVGLANDRERGGVFVSYDAGQHWSQNSAGLDGRDVFALQQSDDGTIVAGTNEGVFVLARNSSEWAARNDVLEKNTFRKQIASTVRSALTAKVNDLEITPQGWLAATPAGLYTTSDDGNSWSRNPVFGKTYFTSVQARGDLVVLATMRTVLISTDGGRKWMRSRSVPPNVDGIKGLTITPDRQIIFTSQTGAFRSANLGRGWTRMQHGLPKSVSSVIYVESGRRLLATSTESPILFESKDGGHTWQRGPATDFALRRLSVAGGRLAAVTNFNGVIVQTDNVNALSVASSPR